jgi:SpoVK/Ycf46/Vps4 family AAA+-type ATPase
MGLDLDAPDMDENLDIEIEIEDPDAEEEKLKKRKRTSDFNENLAEDLDEGVLTELASDLLGEFDEDISPAVKTGYRLT